MTILSVLTTVWAAYDFVWSERGRLFLLAFPPVMAIAILRGLVFAARGAAALAALVVLILVVVFFAYLIMFSVAWHRVYLVPGEEPDARAPLKWGGREKRFLLVTLGVGALVVLIFIGGFLAVSIIAAGPGPFSLPLFLVAGISAWLVSSRLSMLFPSAAVDHRMSFGECWVLTEGNGWRLFFIIFLAGIPLGLVQWLIDLPVAFIFGLLGLSGGLIEVSVRGLLDMIFWFAGAAVGISALSIAYADLMIGGQATSRAGG